MRPQYSHRVAAWDPLGVTPDGHGGANVALWAAGASEVQLCIFDDDGGEQRLPLRERVFNIFHDHIADMPVGTRYGFRVFGPWDPHQGLRWNPSKLLLDPYARAIDGAFVLHPAVFGHLGGDDTTIDERDSAPYVPRSVVAESAFDWGQDHRPETSWSDTIIYETHVRGISLQHPAVPPELRGTYAGLAHPAIIEHLTDLGVTAVELLPVHQFIDEVHLIERGLSNYWGYNSIGFFAPHAGYSASGSRGQQVTEFKTMVKALHAAGLEVILDVVYNHTAEGNERGPTLSFRGIDNDDYYRLQADRRFYTDYTGCGNTLNAARPHVLQVIMDSLRYWVTEMHVDGFRFDLASALARSFHDVDMLSSFLSTISQDPVLRRVKLIAEPWDVGPGGYQVGEFPPLWTEWNDKYRDCVRDYWRGSVGIGELGWRLTGSADLYASEGRRPFASINYVTAHDGFTLNDLVSYDHKHNDANLEDNRDGTDDNRSWNCGFEGPTQDVAINELRARQRRNFLTMMLLSTGVPMLCGGDEFGRTQRGNNNAYCQDNAISWYDWDHQPWQRELITFTKQLIALRREHPALRQRYFFAGRPLHEGGLKDVDWIGVDGRELSEAAWADPGTRTLGIYLNGHEDSSFLILFHAGSEPCTFTLPGPTHGSAYDLILDSVGAPARTGIPPGAVIHLAPLSSAVLQVATDVPHPAPEH
jgi:isoamylase